MSTSTSTTETPENLAVLLHGGPASLTTVSWTVRSQTQRVKIPHLNGYEHFERTDDVVEAGHPVVFRWVMRTAIAE